MKIVQLPNEHYAIARRTISTLWLKEEYLDLEYLSSRGVRLWWEHDSKYINDCCCEELSKAEDALRKVKYRKFPHLRGKKNTFDK